MAEARKLGRPKSKSVRKGESRLTIAIRQWLLELPAAAHEGLPDDLDLESNLLSHAPKRWVTYVPMVLLPSGSFTSARWTSALEALDEISVTNLWRHILRELSATTHAELTHLAVNEGIPLKALSAALGADGRPGEENVLRSPSQLRTLYGDFGPSMIGAEPTARDLDEALWVSTTQNGIHQTWAPRWTMFSRGNVKEKARLLAFHDEDERHQAKLGHRVRLRSQLRDQWAVDLYAGIGYFVFSYARLGLRVLCWEINAWSVEGLRRGAVKNGWEVCVVQGPALQRPTCGAVAGDARIVVFVEDNRNAEWRIRELQSAGHAENILHVNCGFLPTSEPTWNASWQMTRPAEPSWLHLHENVGVDDIPARREEIRRMFEGWRGEEAEEGGREVTVEHVELVKTFAPGVWHCVFDVYVTRHAVDAV